MTIGVSTKETWQFVTAQDKRAQKERGIEPSVWTLGGMSIADEAWVTDQAGLDGMLPMGTVSLRLCRKYIRSVEPFNDKDGNPITLRWNDGGLLDDDSLSRIPRLTRIEIAYALIGNSRVDDEIVGKSEPPSTSPTEE